MPAVHASQSRSSLALFVLLAIFSQSQAFAQCVDQWLYGPDQGNQGVSGTVNASLEWTFTGTNGPQQQLVVAGKFTQAGLAVAYNLALCDSQNQWTAFGAGANAEVRALSSYNGQLIAAGDFTEINGVAANRIAAWDGAAWIPLGSGLNGSVRALRVVAGTLYVAGTFTGAGNAPAMRVASWNGSQWSALGDGLTGGTEVRALEEFQNRLFAAGNFTKSGALNTPSLASWDGSTWRAETPSNDSVFALASWDGMLYAGGNSSTKPLQVWNGTVWSDVGAGISGSSKYVYALREFNGRLAVGGSFLQAGAVTVNSVALWDGNQWSALGNGVGSGSVLSLATFGGNLVASGSFTAHSVPAFSIALWNGAAWTSLGSGLFAPQASPPYVTSFCNWNGDLVMAGYFNTISSVHAESIAIRHAGTWSPFAIPMGNFSPTVQIFAMLPQQDSLIVAGRFSSAGGIPAANIARWNGTTWSAFGTGYTSNIRALVMYNNELVVASDAMFSGPWSPGQTLARWDGSQFRTFNNGPNGAVYALAVHRGELMVGGRFTAINGNTFIGSLARWNGTQWSTLADKPDRQSAWVNALTVFEGDLIAGGRFTINSIGAQNTARWNGQSWSTLGNQAPLGEVVALAVHQGALFAAHSNQSSSSRLSRWSGSAWSDVGTIFGGNLSTLFSFENELLLGGTLTSANGQVSVGWARYATCPACPADLNSDTVVNDEDFTLFLPAYNALDCADATMPASCASDFNADGFVDDADFIAFVAAYDTLLCP